MVLLNRCLERTVTRGQITFCEILSKDDLQRLTIVMHGVNWFWNKPHRVMGLGRSSESFLCTMLSSSADARYLKVARSWHQHVRARLRLEKSHAIHFRRCNDVSSKRIFLNSTVGGIQIHHTMHVETAAVHQENSRLSAPLPLPSS